MIREFQVARQSPNLFPQPPWGDAHLTSNQVAQGAGPCAPLKNKDAAPEQYKPNLYDADSRQFETFALC